MIPLAYSQSDDDVDAAQAANLAALRLQTPTYVEVRALLVPATDYLAQAVEAADKQGAVTGDLLVMVSFSMS